MHLTFYFFSPFFPQDEEEEERGRDEGKNGRIEPVGRADSISLE